MIESYENTIQVIILLICVGITLYRALTYWSRTWTMLFYFYACWLLADTYWVVCLFIYKQTPQISLIPDLSWYASFIFLYLLLNRVAPVEGRITGNLLPWLGPAFAAVMGIYFMTFGAILANLVTAILMGILLYASIRRLLERERYRKQNFLVTHVFIFCLLEYGMWISSCIWSGDTLAYPYYWFDFLLTINFLFLIPAAKKAVVS